MMPVPLQEAKPRRSTMKVLGKTVGSNAGRWYWSIRPEYGVPEVLGVNGLWGVMYDTREQAEAAYKRLSHEYSIPSNAGEHNGE